jgi:hypothetical protein
VLAIAFEVLDEWITKIRIELQILPIVSVVVDERETSVVSDEKIRELVRL